ncbi:uncharacterized protein LOC124131143 isoform X1 [Haliotis rufescens]|uniref:uncharacterized protein LOC124131143 isoform X1 n=1 Tax=Haliotis rufescens TaxID=6454 RepID=UPI001EAFFA44|nr:uncharacterized protein LOC124131143 isoform X1 [Haliotis rufescens]
MQASVWTGCAVGMVLAVTLTLTSAQPKAGCYFEQVAGNNTVYLDTYSGSIMPCASGTVFNVKTCTCVHGENKFKWCRPRFAMDFNSKTVKNKVIRYNIGGGETLDLYKGFAHFTEDSSAIFWTFKDRPFDPNLQVQMRFKDDPTSKAKKQVLLTNCDAKDPPGKPSLLVFLDKTQLNHAKKNLVRVRARTYNMSQGVEVVVPFKSGEFNTLVVLKAMDTLSVRIDYEHGGRTINSNGLVGDLVKSNSALRLGSCPMQKNGFVGVLDWFDYYPCWPKV